MMRGVWIGVLALCVGCGGGNKAAGGGGGGTLQAAPLLVAAGMTALEPAQVGAVDPQGVDLARLGVGAVDALYELTTPAGQAFLFDIITRGAGNEGPVRVSVAHGLDGTATPVGGAESLAGAGIVPSGTGIFTRDPWIDAAGDGFSRFTCGGVIEKDQVLVVETDDGRDTTRALICVRIGPPSPINDTIAGGADDPGIVDRVPLYSSESWRFGLPAVAVSGDRTSVVVYEGDREDPFASDRYEMRVQFDHLTRTVTGGGEVEPSIDFGHWRDHEIAALFNVLAIARSGTDSVRIRLSFDRGATIGQLVDLPTGFRNTRLVQAAMALDYTLAVLFWRGSELTLVEGRPSAFDATNSPIQFAFDAPVVLFRSALDVTPFLMGVTYSDDGHLAIGYGFSSFERQPDATWTSLTQYRVAVRRFGTEPFVDRLLEEEKIVGRDPSVAIHGERVFCAFEGANGIHLYESADLGATWKGPVRIGTNGASQPTVFARPNGSGVSVDVLYLASGEEGTELRRAHWADFDAGGAAQDRRLTRAERIDSDKVPPGGAVPGAPSGILPPSEGFRIRQVGWFGYDATLDGDEIVVVYDQETYDAYSIFYALPIDPFAPRPAFEDTAAGALTPASPPPLAPGLTEPLPLPDEDALHVLYFLRLEAALRVR